MKYLKFYINFYFKIILLGILIGTISSLVLVISQFLINKLWYDFPTHFNLPVYYPLILGIIGGILVGFVQTKVGVYPRTFEETISEFKETGEIRYKGEVWRNFFPALIVIVFGASVGPAAAITSIIGTLIGWYSHFVNFSLMKKENILKIGANAVNSSSFFGLLSAIGERIENDEKFIKKIYKIIPYTISSISGLIAFLFFFKRIPDESVLGINIPNVEWQFEVIYAIVPTLVIGILFGYLFQWIDKFVDNIAKKINRPFFFAILGGVAIGIFGMMSPYFLFSGQFELIEFSKEAMSTPIYILIIIALGKSLLTHLCVSFGWRGGKIFPALFASVSIGFCIAIVMPYMPILIIAIAVATSISIITKMLLFIAIVLILLFPLQFFPFILGACYIAKFVDEFIQKKILV